MISYLKNQFADEHNVKITAQSPVFQWGVGFFTTLKYQNGTFQFLEEHLKRLEISAKYYGFVFPQKDYMSLLSELIFRNNLEAGRIKIILFEENPGDLEVYIQARELNINKDPKKLLIAPHRRGENPIFRHKTLNFFENIHNQKQAKKSGYDDFLYLDHHNNILETSFSNIFFVKKNIIVTPSADLPILNGIIRQQLLKNPSCFTEEGKINVDGLSEYNGCFITNSIHGLVEVKQISWNNSIYNFSLRLNRELIAEY
jgi:4-amino-4-deoxychorismate lyase